MAKFRTDYQFHGILWKVYLIESDFYDPSLIDLSSSYTNDSLTVISNVPVVFENSRYRSSGPTTAHTLFAQTFSNLVIKKRSCLKKIPLRFILETVFCVKTLKNRKTIEKKERFFSSQIVSRKIRSSPLRTSNWLRLLSSALPGRPKPLRSLWLRSHHSPRSILRRWRSVQLLVLQGLDAKFWEFFNWCHQTN